jgi:hypothetical protein
MHRGRILGALVAAYLVVPILTVELQPRVGGEDCVAKVGVVGKLNETLAGKLQYFKVRSLKGRSPGPEFVVTIDRDYTRGAKAASLQASDRFRVAGGIMTPEIYYGEQYLFFGLPQIYASQIKQGLFWPTQRIEMRLLYLAPLISFWAPITVITLPGSEEYTPLTFGVSLTKTFVIGLAVGLALWFRRSHDGLLIIALGYAIASMALTIPIVQELY